MSKILKFKRIQKENIFCDDFIDLEDNNEIDFQKKNIAIVYAPNGTGKSTLSKILDFEKGTNFELTYDNSDYSTENKKRLFHKISDQICRNIIEGEAGDFVLGDNIRKERELKNDIDNEFKELFNSKLIPKLKEEFAISKQSSLFVKDCITNLKIQNYVSFLVNKQNKGKGIDYFEFITYISTMQELQEDEYDQDKYNYFLNHYDKSKSILKQIVELPEDNIVKNEKVNIIHENEIAIDILKEYIDKHECVVCDSHINDPVKLLENKELNKKRVIESLDEKTKKILEKIIDNIIDDDPFNIKSILINAIKEGDKNYLKELQNDIKQYKELYRIKLNNLFFNSLKDSDLIDNCKKYKTMLEEPLKLEAEDICYIEQVINENIDRNIRLERDDINHEIQIKLDEQLLLQTEREELHLSTGEQNFISLAFELLKARNSKEEIVIIDDPISSFDSIYKNKIAFAIVKFLENKKQIILTHNIEAIKLLEYQQQGCFNLYLLNNIPGEVNGLIHISSSEQKLLLNLNLLIDFFRRDVFEYIKNEQLFIISVIPFMRGYANIIGDSLSYKNLTSLMHGYENEEVNVTTIYNELFEDKTGRDVIKKIENKYELSVKNILNIDIEKEIIDSDEYGLLNRTLYHSLIYLYLRLYTEKNLVEIYNLDTSKEPMLAQIIRKAFNSNDNENIKNRIFFNSKKTLLNEFNHFEGNMNIFQPAIDISDDSLEKEKDSIIKKITQLKDNAEG